MIGAKGPLRTSHASPTWWHQARGSVTASFPQQMCGLVWFGLVFKLFNHLWTYSCFHQSSIQRWLKVELLQEHWFDFSFPPTTYQKTKGCQSPLFKTVTSRGREEGKENCLAYVFSPLWVGSWMVSFQKSVPFQSHLHTPELSLWIRIVYKCSHGSFTILLYSSFFCLSRTYRGRVLHTWKTSNVKKSCLLR